MFENHVFQFDFLNDDFLPQNPDVVVEPVETTKKTMKSKGKIPDDLYEILADEEKRKKLVIYINPPYAEVSSQKITTEGKKSKAGVNNSCIHDLYFYAMGIAARELYIQFLARIFFEIKGFIIGEFSKLKLLQGAAFEQFRNYFTAKLEKSFIVPSWTFDNVRGKFPIGFFIWNTNAVIEPVKMTKNSNESGFDKLNHRIVADVFDTENKFISVKKLFNCQKKSSYKQLDFKIQNFRKQRLHWIS